MSAVPTARRAAAAPANTAASAKLVAGPDAAIQNSAPGVVASPPRRAMPPNNHNFTPSTLTPSRRATIACVSS